MSSEESPLDNPGRKAALAERKHSERAAHRNLDEVTDRAIALAMELAPVVVNAPSQRYSDQVIEVELASLSEAEFVRKRINDALKVAEWLTEVRAWIWKTGQHGSQALSPAGKEVGFEIRLGQVPDGVYQ